MRDSLPMKLLPPPLSCVWSRVRIFEKLDEAFVDSEILWIAGSPGAGKSALVASYLHERNLNAVWYRIDGSDRDPEIIFHNLSKAVKLTFPDAGIIILPQFKAEFPSELSTFANCYFELFFRCLQQGTVLVFDDVALPPDSPICELALAALCWLPAGMKIIIISRDAPPAMCARLCANGNMTMIDACFLNLTLDEAVALANSRNGTEPGISFETIKHAHELANGWITGFLLMLDGLHADSLFSLQLPNEHLLFDYLSCEVLEKLNCEEQIFLLKAAVLPEVTQEGIEAITDIPWTILERLHRSHSSLMRAKGGSSPGYIFSHIFRRFLLEKGRSSFTPDERHELIQKVSDRLAHAGKVDEAVDLIAADRHWQAFDTLVSREAPLRLMQGGHTEVLGWLVKVPTQALEQEPGLCYWMGICRMPSGFAESRRWLERSYALYCERQDIVGKLLSWSGIVETIFLEWSDFSRLRKWIAVGEQLLEECGELPKGEIEYRVVVSMFNAMMQGQPDHPQIVVWAGRLFELLRLVEDDSRRLLIGTPLFFYYSQWLGEHACSDIVFDMLCPPTERLTGLMPMARIMLSAVECVYHWSRYATVDAVRAAQDGMEIAEQTGIHTMDFLLNAQLVYAYLGSGEYTQADLYLGRLRERLPRHAPLEHTHYHYLAGWRAMLFDDPNRAIEHLRHCITHANEHTAPIQYALNCIALAQVHHALGEDHMTPLSHASRMAQDTGSQLLTFMVAYSEAAFTLDELDNVACLNALGKALRLANKHDYVNFAWCLPKVLERLCMKALEANIETNFVQRLIRSRRIMPDTPPTHLENWPWPLRVYTLGRFSLVKDGVLLSFSSKAQRKPIEMLKVLIALGGREVHEVKLSDILWPDVEGDRAHSSFTTTLSRLRRYVGEDALSFSNGCLTLNARYCWVDVWAFLRILGEVQEIREKDEVGALARQSIGLYQGNFLNGENDTSCCMAPCDQMRKRLSHNIMACVRQLKEMGREKHAIALSQIMMVADPNIQEFLE